MQARFTHPFIKTPSFVAGHRNLTFDFNGVGALLMYIRYARADDMSDHNKWISYSHWEPRKIGFGRLSFETTSFGDLSMFERCPRLAGDLSKSSG
jgi:hypothetical protein